MKNIFKALRESYHITQQELAVFCDVSRQTVAKWESGASRPKKPAIEKLCLLYGVGEDAFYDAEESAGEGCAVPALQAKACAVEEMAPEASLPARRRYVRHVPRRAAAAIGTAPAFQAEETRKVWRTCLHLLRILCFLAAAVFACIAAVGGTCVFWAPDADAVTNNAGFTLAGFCLFVALACLFFAVWLVLFISACIRRAAKKRLAKRR